MRQNKNNVKMWRKITGLLLSAWMLVSCVPGGVYGAENEVVEQGGAGLENIPTIIFPHTHNWEYKKQGADTISVACTEETGICKERGNGKYLSINIEESYNYPERPAGEVIIIKDASGNAITPNYKELSMADPECQYYKDVSGVPGGQALSVNALLEPGKYWLQVGWSSVTIKKTFTITNSHTHNWEYKKQGTDTISVSCTEESGTCEERESGKYLSIDIAEEYSYPERPRGEVIVIKDVSGNALTLDYKKLGMTRPECKYYKDTGGSPGGEVSAEGSLEAGQYWVKAAWGGASIAKAFTITNKSTRRKSPLSVKMNSYQYGDTEAVGPSLSKYVKTKTIEYYYYKSGEEYPFEMLEDSQDFDPKSMDAGTYYVLAEYTQTDSGNCIYVTEKSWFQVRKGDRSGIKVSMDSYDLKGKKTPKPQLVNAQLEENEKNPRIVYYYSKQKRTTGVTKWSNENGKKLGKGTYYIYAEIGETSNYNAYTTPLKKFTVYPDHKWNHLPKKLVSKSQKSKIRCSYCGETTAVKLPKKTISVTMGESVMVNNKGCTFTLKKPAKVKKQCFSLSKKGKIITKDKPACYKSMQNSVPVAVKVCGKSYSMNVKIKIPAPKVRIVCSEKGMIKSVPGYKFTFSYFIPKANRIQVSMEGENDTIKNYLEKNVSNPRPSQKPYINLTEQFLEKLNNRVTFKIRAYYGKNRSEVFTVTKTVGSGVGGGQNNPGGHLFSLELSRLQDC